MTIHHHIFMRSMVNMLVGVIDIKTLEMLEGDLSNRAYKLVREWAEKYQSDLMEMWNTKLFKKLEGLE